jgi:hypothetical protein
MTVQLRREAGDASTAQVMASQDGRFQVGQTVQLLVKTHGGRTTLEVDGHPASVQGEGEGLDLRIELAK